MLRLVLPCLGLLILACDGGSTSTSTGAQPEAKAPEVAPSEAGPGAEAKAPDSGEGPAGEAKPHASGKARAAEAKAAIQAKPDEAKAAHAQLTKLLNDGRKAVKDKQLDEGIALYRKALEIDPVNPKVLGELGFAAYKKGQLDLAESSTRRAIELAPPDGQGLGALYYNLGLIAEARSELGAAKAAYARSLEVRPGNEIVAAKLAKLADAKLAKGPDDPARLCEHFMATLECVGSQAELDALPADEQEFTGICTCKVREQVKEGTGKSAVEAAAIFELEGNAGYGGYYEGDLHLGLKIAGQGWQPYGQIVNGYTPGVSGISNQGSLELLEFAELGPAPGEELRVEISQSDVDTDMGPNVVYYTDLRSLIVCEQGSDGGANCGRLHIEAVNGVDVLIDGEPHDASIALGETVWRLELGFAEGKVEVKAAPGTDDLPEFFSNKLGTRTLSEFIRLSEAD